MVIVTVLLFLTFAGISNNIPIQDPDASNDTLIYEKWIKIDRTLKDYTNYAIKNVLPVAMDLSGKINISSSCFSQGMKLLSGIKRLETWAISFIDASGKIPDGILRSTTSALGNYDQCLNTYATQTIKQQEAIVLQGKYCLLDIKPPLPEMKEEYFKNGMEQLKNYTNSGSGLIKYLASKAHYFYLISLSMGICVPSGCSSDDVNEIVANVGSQMYVDAKVLHCSIKTPPQFKTESIIAISVYSFLLFLMLMGTVLDLYFQKQKFIPQNKGLRAVIAFSFPKNFQDLIKPDASKDNISCLHGIRFLTITWIISGHTFSILTRFISMHQNLDDLLESTKGFGMQIIVNVIFSVDTFFLIGGLVNCYVMVRDNDKNKSRSIVYSITHRLWRILPLHAVMLLSIHLAPLIISGPADHSPILEKFIDACKHSWWKNIIFINNFGGFDQTCIPQSWYLAAEFQLFLISCVTIRVLLKFPKIGIVLNILMILISSAFSIAWTELTGAYAMFQTTDFNPKLLDLFWNWYVQTLVHAAPYFLGVLIGYMLAKTNDLKISKVVQLCGWCLATFTATWIIFATHKWNNGIAITQVENILYSGFSKIGFTLAVGWVIVCCTKEYGGIVNDILSSKVWTPLSRIAFAMFLISPIVQMSSFLDSKTLRESSTREWVWRFFGDYFVSAFLAALLFISIENPFVTIEKILTTKSVKVDSNNAENNINEAKHFKLETLMASNSVTNSGFVDEDKETNLSAEIAVKGESNSIENNINEEKHLKLDKLMEKNNVTNSSYMIAT